MTRMTRVTLATVFAALQCHGAAAFCSSAISCRQFTFVTPSTIPMAAVSRPTSRLFASETEPLPPQVQCIDKSRMQEIIKDFEEKGREESQYCVIDVRDADEIESTGKISPSVLNLPLSIIEKDEALARSDDCFSVLAQFPKLDLNTTMVFTCAGGKRSTRASIAATKAGYTNVLNYEGGANEWFSS